MSCGRTFNYECKGYGGNWSWRILEQRFYVKWIKSQIVRQHTPAIPSALIAKDLRYIYIYRDADKSLDRSGRKQATATEDFEFHISYL
jgi:hypothetical protein